MITADSITAEQIRELRAIASGTTPNTSDRSMVEICDSALGWSDVEPCLNVHPSHDCVAGQRRDARARCAELLNARNGR
jgi:hypothetical protein